MATVPAVPIDELILFETAAAAPVGSLLRITFEGTEVYALRVDDRGESAVVVVSGQNIGRFMLARDVRGPAFDISNLADLRVRPTIEGGATRDGSYGKVVAVRGTAADGPMALYLVTFTKDSYGDVDPFILLPLKADQPSRDYNAAGVRIIIGRPEIIWGTDTSSST